MRAIIIGAGQVGVHVAGQLSRENKEVVLIDKNPEAVRDVSEKIDVQVLTGPGSSPVVLEEAGIREADILLAVTDSDDTNLSSCLMANILSPRIKKIARLRDAGFDRFHESFQAFPPFIDMVINPEIEVVHTIEKLMRFPGAVDVGEFCNGRIHFIGMILHETDPIVGVPLRDMSLRIGRQIPLIAAVVRKGCLIVPRGSDILLPGDVAYVISEKDRLQQTLQSLSQHMQPVRRVLIIGGGRIGLRLAMRLEQQAVCARIIEKDPLRCAEIAEALDSAIVLHGDGTDQVLLREENVQDMDVVITLTGDDQTNILASLLAKSLGVKNAITRLTQFAYFPLMSTIGLEQVVSPRLSAINTLLQHIRKGKVMSAILLKGEQAEAIEAVASESSDIVGKPIRHISFPKQALIAGIIRKETIFIPGGSDVIQADDRMIIFAGKQAIPQLEKKLTMKLEQF